MKQYTFNFPGHCQSCGQQQQSVYGTNMWNVNGNNPGNNTACGPQRACNSCIEIIKGECILYTKSNLVNTGINKNDDLNTIIEKLDAIKAIQDLKNANILAALNDINSRLNLLEGNSTPHPPYTLL